MARNEENGCCKGRRLAGFVTGLSPKGQIPGDRRLVSPYPHHNLSSKKMTTWKGILGWRHACGWVRDLRGALRFTSRNHGIKNEALLVIYKRAPRNASLSNRGALEEALCFGWIDGWFKPIDNDRWVVRYTPRRRGSGWSDYNIARAWKLLNEGKMTPAGVAKLPSDVVRVWEKYRPSPIIMDSRGARKGEIRFADGKAYLSKVSKPALTP